MRVGVIGAGRIGGGVARLLARAGHEVLPAGDDGEAKAVVAALIDDAGFDPAHVH